MTRTIIPDSWFDTAVNEYDVSPEQINTFVNDLAKEFGSNWHPSRLHHRDIRLLAIENFILVMTKK